MALIKCSECGREISDKSAACIHCGCPISVSKPAQPQPEQPKPAQNGSINFEETFGTYFGGFKVKPAAIQVDLNVRVFGAADGTTVSTVFVKELNENVTFNIPNNIQPGQCIRLEGKGRADANGLRGDLIIHMVTVQRFPAVQSAAAPQLAAQPAPAAKPAPAAASTPNSTAALEGAYRILEAYKPGWLARFCARLLGVLLASVVVFVVRNGADEDALMILLVAAPFAVILWLVAALYPFAKVKRYFRKYGLDEMLKNDTGNTPLSIRMYNLLPGKKMRNYVYKLSPAACQRLDRAIAESKNKKK